MNQQKKIFIVTTIVLLGLFFAGAYFYKQAESKKSDKAVAENQALLIRDYAPTKGSPMLKVTLVEFLDPECEACAYYHPIVKNILKKFDGRLRYVVRYAPFHPDSKFAIKILEAARKQNKYWDTLDVLFKNLSEWGSHHNPQPELVWTYLPELGLNIDQLKKDMKDSKIQKMIDEAMDDVKVFGVRQTPTFFINGKKVKSMGPKQLETAVAMALEE